MQVVHQSSCLTIRYALHGCPRVKRIYFSITVENLKAMAKLWVKLDNFMHLKYDSLKALRLMHKLRNMAGFVSRQHLTSTGVDWKQNNLQKISFQNSHCQVFILNCWNCPSTVQHCFWVVLPKYLTCGGGHMPIVHQSQYMLSTLLNLEWHMSMSILK